MISTHAGSLVWHVAYSAGSLYQPSVIRVPGEPVPHLVKGPWILHGAQRPNDRKVHPPGILSTAFLDIQIGRDGCDQQLIG